MPIVRYVVTRQVGWPRRSDALALPRIYNPPTEELHGDQTRLRGIRNAVIRGSSHSTLTGRERAVGQVYAASTATTRSWVLLSIVAPIVAPWLGHALFAV